MWVYLIMGLVLFLVIGLTIRQGADTETKASKLSTAQEELQKQLDEIKADIKKTRDDFEQLKNR